MANYFLINGYFKDDKSEFSGYIVKDMDDAGEDDDNVFFYGLSENDIKDAIEHGEDTVHDFVITSYEPMF
jgi:hypothetical protein